MSLRLRLLNRGMRAFLRPVLSRAKDPATARRDFALTARLFLHGDRSVSQDEIVLNGVPARRFRPRRAEPGAAVVYLHGGGYIAGSPVTHQAMLSVLAAASGVEVIAPDYPLAPEHPFPAAFDAAAAAWAGLGAAGAAPGRTVLGGDSAGGGLALALLARLTGTAEAPCGVFAYSPWTDLARTGDSLKENAARDVILPAARIGELVEMVLGDREPRDPRVSPLYADFGGAPPVLIQASRSEILRDDSLRMAERMEAAGVEVTLETLEDAPHVWQMLVGLVPEARASLVRTAAFARVCLSLPPRESES